MDQINLFMEKEKKLDFSHYSSEHKKQLWQTINHRNCRCVLSEQELDFSEAGIPESSVQKCDKCESTDTND